MTGIGEIRFDHIGLMVTDIDAAQDWYTQHLGLTVRDRWSNDEVGMKWAHLVAGDLTIELVQRPGLTVGTDSAAGMHHLAITVGDIESAVRALEAAGGTVVFEPNYFARHHMDWAFVRDPFGIVLEVISYRSRE